jgi:multidrug efflux pump subunit AcrA (membrane-fusion protein)
VNQGLFRKEAMSKFLRTDAPGAIITIAPPSTLVVFGAMAVLFVALVLLAVLARAQVVAEGRGVVRPDQPLVVLHAPLAGTVLAVRRGLHEHGLAGDVLLEMDARTESAAHGKCLGVLATEQGELDVLDQHLADWNAATGHEHDASMALVLIAQIRAQREKVTAVTQRCDAVGAVAERSRVTFPVDARVVDIPVTAGSQVHEGDVLATLIPAGTHLVGYLELPEQYRNEVAVGQAVRLKFDAMPSDEVGAGVAHVTHLLDALPSGVKLDAPEAGGVSVEVSLDAMPAGSGPPRSGMTFAGGVLTRKARLISLLFGGADE